MSDVLLEDLLEGLEKPEDDFESVMFNMKSHYQDEEATTVFALPISFAAATAAPPPEVVAIKTQVHYDLTKSADTEKAGIETAADTLKENPTDAGVDDFTAMMNAQREEVKRKSNETIDKAYDKAIAIGKNKPKAVQNAIVVGMNVVMGVVSKVKQLIVDFVTAIVDKIWDFLVAAGKWIVNLFSKVGSAIASLF